MIPHNPFSTGVDYLVNYLTAAMMPVARRLTSTSKPNVHLLLGIVGWNTGVAATYLGNDNRIWAIVLFAIGAIHTFTSVTASGREEARADINGDLRPTTADKSSSDIFLPLAVFFWADAPGFSQPLTLTLALISMLCLSANAVLYRITAGIGDPTRFVPIEDEPESIDMPTIHSPSALD